MSRRRAIVRGDPQPFTNLVRNRDRRVLGEVGTANLAADLDRQRRHVQRQFEEQRRVALLGDASRPHEPKVIELENAPAREIGVGRGRPENADVGPSARPRHAQLDGAPADASTGGRRREPVSDHRATRAAIDILQSDDADRPAAVVDDREVKTSAGRGGGKRRLDPRAGRAFRVVVSIPIHPAPKFDARLTHGRREGRGIRRVDRPQGDRQPLLRERVHSKSDRRDSKGGPSDRRRRPPPATVRATTESAPPTRSRRRGCCAAPRRSRSPGRRSDSGS